MTLHLADLQMEARAAEVAVDLQDDKIRWIDLPPVLLPSPPHPPTDPLIAQAEAQVSNDKSLPKIFLMAGDEFSGDRAKSFLSKDCSLLEIGPHVVSRYKIGGPISPGLFGPVSANFVSLTNLSEIGQSWYEVAIARVDHYVEAWCSAQPSVTVLGLGLWDLILGRIGWTPQCASNGVFSAYILEHLNMFIESARRFSRRQSVDFEAWYARHRFIMLSLPTWFCLDDAFATRFTISPATYARFRKRAFKDMYKVAPNLWESHRAVVYTPRLPVADLQSAGDYYLLGPAYNKFYMAQVFAICARIVCRKPCCDLPSELDKVKKLLLGCPDDVGGMCGRYWARFMPQGVNFAELWELGHT